jgi:hypothetical protein
MARWGGIRSGSSTRKPKRLASSGRNVEVQGGLIVDHAGERGVRCSRCGAVVPLAKWWHHGTSDDPHRQPQ